MTVHSGRLDALPRSQVLDAPPEDAFDRITDLAAYLFDAPIALVSLVDDHRQWLKSCFGFDRREAGLEEAFCAHAIQSGEVMVVEDAARDARFAGHPLVTTDPGVRFYAGAPLITADGLALGTLCVMDTKPRSPSRAMLARLESLARMVIDELELRLQMAERKQVQAELERHLQEYEAVFDSAHDILFIVDVQEGPEGPVFTYLRFNHALSAYGDLSPEEAIGSTPSAFFGEKIGADLEAKYCQCVEAQATTEFDVAMEVSGERLVWHTRLSPVMRGGTVKQIVGIARDISEHRRLRESLRKERDFLQRTEKVARVGGWEYDPVADWAHVTDEVYRLLGIPRDDGICLEEAIAPFLPESRSKLRRMIERCIEDGSPYDVELELVTPKGTTRIVRARGRATREEDQTTRLTGTLQDITERKEREETIRLHRDLLRNLFETSPTAITMVDTEGRVILGNQHAEELLGLERSELVSRTYNDPEWRITAPDGGEFAEVELPFTRVMQSGEPVFDVEHAIERPDGTRRILRVNGAPLRDGDTVQSIVFVMEDITERWETEQQLLRSREELAEAQRIARIGSWSYDLEKQEMQCSQQTYRLAGWDPTEPVAYDSFLAAVHPADRDWVRSCHQQFLECLEPADFQYRFIRADGEERIFHEQAEAVVDEEGTLVRISGTLRDITEQKRTERELIRAKETAEEMSRLKSAFLVNMSHEVRTPLTSIIGFSEMLEEMELGEPANRFARHVRHSGYRLLETFNSILDLSQLEAGTKVLHMSDTVLQNFVSELVERFQEQANVAEIDLAVHMPPDPIDVVIDRSALERVMCNLLGNAIKFTEPGGQVMVRIQTDRETFSLVVEDSGIGIDPEFLPHLFDAFRQESSGNSRAYEGAGLGLTIAKKLVDLMDGSIEVESDQKGAGARFTVRLPRESAL